MRGQDETRVERLSLFATRARRAERLASAMAARAREALARAAGAAAGRALAAAVVVGVAAMTGAAPAARARQTGETGQKGGAQFTLRVRPNDPATIEGFDHFYNMEYGEAIADFERSLASHPQNPYAVNHLLEAVLFRELHREGKLDAQLYLSNEFVHFQAVPVDAAAVARVDQLQARAAELEEKELAGNPNNAAALYARSVTRGLLATEQGLIKKAWFAGLRSGLGAYDDSKRVLELDPSDNKAKLIVGIYNYVVGSLPWPVKLAALLATIHGSKAKGLELMREAAASQSEASVDAKTTLALFLAREHQYGEALALVGWLYRTFPRNFLYGLSEASLLKSDGKTEQSVAAYRRLVEEARHGAYPHQKVELAAMGLGNLLRAERRWSEAAAAYDEVMALPHPDPEIAAGAVLAAGQMYDRQGERARAIERYQNVLKMTSDEDLLRQAQEGLKKAYRGK